MGPNGTSPKTATASCPAGEVALGGGGIMANGGSGTIALNASYPSSDTVWTMVADRQSGSGNWSLQAYVICATAAP